MRPEAEPMNVFSPRSDSERLNPFMPHHPLFAMEKSDISPVPYMLGYAAKEGIWRANYLLPDPSSDIWNDFVRNIDQGTEWSNWIYTKKLCFQIYFRVISFGKWRGINKVTHIIRKFSVLNPYDPPFASAQFGSYLT